MRSPSSCKTFWFLTTTEHLHEDAPHLLRGHGDPAEWDEGAGAGR